MGLLNKLFGRNTNSKHEQRIQSFRNPSGTGILNNNNNTRESPALCNHCEGSRVKIEDDDGDDDTLALCDDCPVSNWSVVPEEIVDDLGEQTQEEQGAVRGLNTADKYTCPDCVSDVFHVYLVGGGVEVDAVECADPACDFRTPDSVDWDVDDEWTGHEAGR